MARKKPLDGAKEKAYLDYAEKQSSPNFLELQIGKKHFLAGCNAFASETLLTEIVKLQAEVVALKKANENLHMTAGEKLEAMLGRETLLPRNDSYKRGKKVRE